MIVEAALARQVFRVGVAQVPFARRLAIVEPVERIAAGCGAFVAEALRNPAWGALVARGAVSMPEVAQGARARLISDIRSAGSNGRLGDVMPELALEFAIGIVLQAMQAAAQGSLVRRRRAGVASRSRPRTAASVVTRRSRLPAIGCHDVS